MALIKCEECGREVSEKASACPGCGAPVGGEDRQPVVVEQTAKHWKGHILAGLGTAIVGLVIAVIAPLVGTPPRGHMDAGMVLGVVMLLGGILWFIGAAIGAWWHHG